MGDECVTVVVPARNEEAHLGACLDSILGQDYPHLQVVVVDGASTDRTAEVVRQRMATDPRVELLHQDRTNIPSSLNLGLAAARGTWLVRVDAHCTIPSSYVATAVRDLREGTWAGVGGRKDGVGRTPAGRAVAVAMSSRLAVGGSTYHYGTTRQETDHLPFGAYPVEVLRRSGGWDESLTANEDFELDHRLRRAGHRLLFDPDMAIAWHCRQSLRDLARQYARYGRGKVDVVQLHPGSLSPRHVAPPFLVGYLATAAVVAPRAPSRAAGMVAPYLAALLVEGARQAPRLTSPAERIQVPAAIATMHVAWGVGFWSGVRANLAGRLPRPRARTTARAAPLAARREPVHAS